jgi:lipopolysaccharide transport protein LptA
MAALRASRHATSVAAAASTFVLAMLGLSAATPATSAAGSSTFENCTGTITIDGRKGKTKFPKGGVTTTSLENVTITGCDMEIKANLATSDTFDLKDSDWTLNGNVRIRSNQQQSRINADQAVVLLRNSEIQRLTITGKPAEFEQKRPGSDVVTRGHARQIVYEAGPGIVNLVDDAWLNDGSGKTLQSPALWYDIRKAEMGYSGKKGGKGEGSPASETNDGDRVIITIDPKASKGAKKDDSAKPTGTPAPPASQNASPANAPTARP